MTILSERDFISLCKDVKSKLTKRKLLTKNAYEILSDLRYYNIYDVIEGSYIINDNYENNFKKEYLCVIYYDSQNNLKINVYLKSTYNRELEYYLAKAESYASFCKNAIYRYVIAQMTNISNIRY